MRAPGEAEGAAPGCWGWGTPRPPLWRRHPPPFTWPSPLRWVRTGAGLGVSAGGRSPRSRGADELGPRGCSGGSSARFPPLSPRFLTSRFGHEQDPDPRVAVQPRPPHAGAAAARAAVVCLRPPPVLAAAAGGAGVLHQAHSGGPECPLQAVQLRVRQDRPPVPQRRAQAREEGWVSTGSSAPAVKRAGETPPPASASAAPRASGSLLAECFEAGRRPCEQWVLPSGGGRTDLAACGVASSRGWSPAAASPARASCALTCLKRSGWMELGRLSATQLPSGAHRFVVPPQRGWGQRPWFSAQPSVALGGDWEPPGDAWQQEASPRRLETKRSFLRRWCLAVPAARPAALQRVPRHDQRSSGRRWFVSGL